MSDANPKVCIVKWCKTFAGQSYVATEVLEMALVWRSADFYQPASQMCFKELMCERYSPDQGQKKPYEK